MTKMEEIEVSQKVQVKFSNYFAHFSKNLSLPEQKFIQDMSRGILASQSCILRQISHNLKEDIDLKKVCKRLSYHLRKDKLESLLANSQIRSSCRKSTRDTLFIVDPSDVFKQYAKKMEGLSRVRDGSRNIWVNGYETLNILSVTKKQKELVMKPIVSELFSYKQEIDTSKNILFDHLISTIIASNNQGVYVFDRAFDDKTVFSFFRDHNAPFIIRSMATRDLYHHGRKMKFIEAAKQVKLSHTFTIQKKSRKGKIKEETVYAGIIDIEIPLSPHPRKKNPDLFSAKLFVGRYKNGGYWYILCSLPNHSDLSDDELIEFVFNAYKIRWKIEETHRHIKQDFKWESMRLLKYKRLKLLNAILWIAIGFLYSLQSLKYQFIKAFHYYMLDQKKKINKIPDFLFYRIVLVVNECFSIVGKYKKTRYWKSKNDKNQLMIPNLLNFLGI